MLSICARIDNESVTVSCLIETLNMTTFALYLEPPFLNTLKGLMPKSIHEEKVSIIHQSFTNGVLIVAFFCLRSFAEKRAARAQVLEITDH